MPRENGWVDRQREDAGSSQQVASMLGITLAHLLSSIVGCEGFRSTYSLHGERTNETSAAGFYPDRTDDRGGDRRYSGGHRVAGVSGLRDSGEDVRRCGCAGG